MSKRQPKELPVQEEEQVEEQVEEQENEIDEIECQEDVNPKKVSKFMQPNPYRVCISCGSSANLFKTKTHKTCIECCNLRPKKTEKQLESFKRAREIRQANIQRRKQEIEELEKQAKEELDKKIVSKAISIKKKLIKQNVELDAVSDDDTPLEEVMKIAKKKPIQKKQSSVENELPQKKVSNKRVTISEDEYQSEPQYQQPQQHQIPQIRRFNFL